jgi:1-deoxy-D-xylulose-5-phosphate reductoisomerase
MEKQRLVILGSTGSIGQSTLNIVRRFPDQFEVVGLVAGSNERELAAQIAEFSPQVAGLVAPASTDLRSSVNAFFTGPQCACRVLEACDFDTVIGAIVGIAGLESSYLTMKLGKRLLLANKESLVCAGQLLMDTAQKTGGTVVPVDSEHSALAQLLEHARASEVSRLTLTASGGPFLSTPLGELGRITPAQAVKHPKWSMGQKISVDSSTMVNKALELIEACWLFGLEHRYVDVVVHPQSIVHALVTFKDEVQLAHLSVPDMQGPISFALMRPHDRLPGAIKPLSLVELGALTFQELDEDRFPAISLARECLEVGGTACTIFNAANEVAVAKFLSGNLAWLDIVPTIRQTVETFESVSFSSIEELLELHIKVVTHLQES